MSVRSQVEGGTGGARPSPGYPQPSAGCEEQPLEPSPRLGAGGSPAASRAGGPGEGAAACPGWERGVGQGSALGSATQVGLGVRHNFLWPEKTAMCVCFPCSLSHSVCFAC